MKVDKYFEVQRKKLILQDENKLEYSNNILDLFEKTSHDITLKFGTNSRD